MSMDPHEAAVGAYISNVTPSVEELEAQIRGFHAAAERRRSYREPEPSSSHVDNDTVPVAEHRPQHQLLTFAETAAMLRKTDAQLRWMVHQNTAPPSGLIGGRRMFRLADVETHVNAAFGEDTVATVRWTKEPVRQAKSDDEQPTELPSLLLADAPDLMSPATLSAALDDIKVATLAEWRTKDKGKRVDQMVGPPWRKLGGAVRYLKVDVVAWIERQPVGKTS